MMKIDGGCHCGNITYSAEIDPENVGICHCTDCQTLSGTAFRTSVRATKEDVSFEWRTTENLCKDCRKRRQARPSILSGVRHSALFGGRGRPASVQYPRRHGTPASRAETKSTRVVPICTRVGK